MKVLGREWNIKSFLYVYVYTGLILLDILLITIALIFEIPASIASDIRLFDLIVCIMLLTEWIWNLHISTSKKDFLTDKVNILWLIASIPFDFILPEVLPGLSILRYLRLFYIFRIFLLSSRISFTRKLFEKTALHKIIAVIVITVALFTILFELFGTSYAGFDDFYFVLVTLTTVGYGDVTPKTYNEKVLSIILLLIGIFIFSAITASLSSFLTDRLIENDEKDMEDKLNEKIDGKSEIILDELNKLHEENKELHREIDELKEIIENKKD